MPTCNCEHISHIDKNSEAAEYWLADPRFSIIVGTGHPMFERVLSDEDTDRAQYVGEICKECAETCMKDHLV